ncbi:MAG: peptidylprolyl isomerase [Thermoplasmatota archaeon]
MPQRRSVVIFMFIATMLLFVSQPAGSLGSAPEEAGVVYTEPRDLGRPNRLAVIEVRGYGEIRIELYENMTPITTKNFIDLAQSGFYDGISFHRVIDNFVAQTGDPNTRNMNPYDDGMGGSDTTIPLEICSNASHIDGAVGMARSSEPDSASSQFYICDGPQHNLDDWVRMENYDEHGYAVFGVVVEGLDVAKEIAAAETYPDYRVALKDHPVDDIVMESVYIIDPPAADNETIMEKEENDGREIPFPGLSIIIFAVVVVASLTGKRSRKSA